MFSLLARSDGPLRGRCEDELIEQKGENVSVEKRGWMPASAGRKARRTSYHLRIPGNFMPVYGNITHGALRNAVVYDQVCS